MASGGGCSGGDWASTLGGGAAGVFVIVWVAADPLEAVDPDVGTAQHLLVRAVAFGPRGVRQGLEASVWRAGPRVPPRVSRRLLH